MKTILYIGNKLSKHGFNSTIIETLGNSLSNEGYHLIYASEKKNQILRFLDMVFTTVLNYNKVDYVLIDTYSTFSFYYVVLISKLCSILNLKYIPILHGGNLPIRLKNSTFLSNLIFNNSLVNVAPSNYLLEAFKNSGYKNCIYIPNSLEISKYYFQQRKEFEPKLLWVRSFSAIYNPIMALKVTKELVKKFPNTKLCMVGPDIENLVDSLKEFAQQNSIDVIFTGKLSKKDWIELSEEYSIFINTTHLDNTPISILEAMALGLPVVSTNVGGIPFLIENYKTGILVNDNNIIEMANSVEIILKDKEIAEEIVKNAKLYVNNFDWNIVKYKWFEILK